MIHETRKNLTMLQQVDWARLAAFIDGEGTIRIAKHLSGSHRGGWSSRIVISNTDILLISWLKNTFGGYVYNVKPKNKKNKPSFQWIFSSKIESILIRCLPYFIVKREQAEIALAFVGTKFTEAKEKEETRESLKRRLIILQKRGVASNAVAAA